MLDAEAGRTTMATIAWETKGQRKMKWDTLDLRELGQPSCGACGGTGARLTKTGEAGPCECSLRVCFRACYKRFRECSSRERGISQVSYKETPIGKSHRGSWSRKEEEYIADFEMVSRRNLDEWHYKMFRYHYLMGADWRLCSRQFAIPKGYFFHAIYRIEQRLGRVFYELQPYALYPTHDYFALRLPGPIQATRVNLNQRPKPPAFQSRKPGLIPAAAERLSA